MRAHSTFWCGTFLSLLLTVPGRAEPSLPAPDSDRDGLPDPAKWDYDTERNRLGWYNNELQYYADRRPENARVENGRLVITARQERLSSAPDFGGQNYTSARLITQGLASWTYGHFEVRAKLPCGLGTWPAIWMLPQEAGAGWPSRTRMRVMGDLL